VGVLSIGAFKFHLPNIITLNIEHKYLEQFLNVKKAFRYVTLPAQKNAQLVDHLK
jgi:hypothetical protein